MTNKILSYAVALFSIVTCISFTSYVSAQDKFQIQENELKSLNLSPGEEAEFKKFLNELNNLPAEDQEMIAQLGQEMEKQMRKEGLDPANPDDIFKWVEAQGPALEQPLPPDITAPPVAEEPRIEKPQPQAPIIAIAAPADAKIMLTELVAHVASLRQKAAVSERLWTKLERYHQELNDLTYYLHILTQPDLLKHLTSEKFKALYKNLEALHSTFATYEPSVIVKAPSQENLDNPYELLGLDYSASQDEITQAFKHLEKVYDPAELEDEFKSQGMTTKDLAKKLKEARLQFRFIQNAYDSLIDPKERAIVDRSLKDQIAQAKRSEKSSSEAFEKIAAELTSKVYLVIGDIQKLLAAFKPEELAKAKAHEELEKKILEESKKPVKIQPSRIEREAVKTAEQRGKEYYEEMRRKDERARIFRPHAPWSSSYTPFEQQKDKGFSKPSGDGKPPKKEEKKKDEKKDDKKKDEKKEDKKDAKKDGKKDDGKKSGDKKDDKKAELTEKDVELSTLISAIGGLLEQTKDEIERELPAKRTAPDEETSEEPEKKKIKLNDLAKQLEDYFTSQPKTFKKGQPNADALKEQEVIKDFLEFAKQNKWEELAKKFGELKGKLKGKPHSSVEKAWKDKIASKFGKRIESWSKLAQSLSQSGLQEKGKKTNEKKFTFHRISSIDLKKIKDIKKDIPPITDDDKTENPGLLPKPLTAELRYVDDIKAAYESIKKTLGSKK